MKTAKNLFIAPLIALFLFSGCAVFLDELGRRNVYFPEKYTGGVPSGAKELWIDAPKTAKVPSGKINALWIEKEDKKAPALLYLHGNSGNIYTDIKRIRAICDAGFSVLAIDYRGYGKSSECLPDEEALYADANASWNRLKSLSPNSARRIVYGYSLGSAVATELAVSESGVDGLVIEGGFSSLIDVAYTTYFRFLPIPYIMSQKYLSIDKIGRVKAPKLIIHSELDKTVPVELGRELYEAASEPKVWLPVKGGTHKDAYKAAGDEWVSQLRKIGGLQ